MFYARTFLGIGVRAILWMGRSRGALHESGGLAFYGFSQGGAQDTRGVGRRGGDVQSEFAFRSSNPCRYCWPAPVPWLGCPTLLLLRAAYNTVGTGPRTLAFMVVPGVRAPYYLHREPALCDNRRNDKPVGVRWDNTPCVSCRTLSPLPDEKNRKTPLPPTREGLFN